MILQTEWKSHHRPAPHPSIAVGLNLGARGGVPPASLPPLPLDLPLRLELLLEEKLSLINRVGAASKGFAATQMRTDAYRQVNPLSCVGIPGWVSLVPFFQWYTYQITQNIILIVDHVAFLPSPLLHALSLSSHPPQPASSSSSRWLMPSCTPPASPPPPQGV